MKPTLATVLIAFTLCLSVFAKDKDLNPADYPLTAEILGSGTTVASSFVLPPVVIGVYGGGSTSTSVSRETDIRIGKFIYASPKGLRNLAVGGTYPAQTNGKEIKILSDGKVYSFHISGTRMAQ